MIMLTVVALLLQRLKGLWKRSSRKSGCSLRGGDGGGRGSNVN